MSITLNAERGHFHLANYAKNGASSIYPHVFQSADDVQWNFIFCYNSLIECGKFLHLRYSYAAKFGSRCSYQIFGIWIMAKRRHLNVIVIYRRFALFQCLCASHSHHNIKTPEHCIIQYFLTKNPFKQSK